MNTTAIFSAITLLLLLSGCSTSKDKILPSDSNMLQIWQEGASQTHQVQQARDALHRPLNESEQVAQEKVAQSYSRTQYSEFSQQFPRLPNPDLIMYIFPHLSAGAPVPGYSTIFPFYNHPEYALPGERTGAL